METLKASAKVFLEDMESITDLAVKQSVGTLDQVASLDAETLDMYNKINKLMKSFTDYVETESRIIDEINSKIDKISTKLDK